MMHRTHKIVKILGGWLITATSFLFVSVVWCQSVADQYERIKAYFNDKSYYSTVNLCKQVIQRCETAPEPECWYTNIMKDIYRYKGFTEFELFKAEQDPKRLTDAIESLTISFNLFKDPDVQFVKGYLIALNAIRIGNRTDLSGLVTAWEALLSLHAREGWQVSAELLDKIKLFIRIAERYTEPVPNKNYQGVFARFIILLALDLAEKGKLKSEEQKEFETLRQKYYREDGEQWQKWRSNSSPPK
ncbi:MAG: hypothetical protein ONB32_01410 [candidate division KSB1 bacterium]|nr:hypothetical protein [candidate division KSB1 bacterium]MDZ7400552.1 hypothetical protein [candidate division KSB1 bacterium]